MLASCRFVPRFVAFCVVLLVAVAWASCPAAEATPPSGAGWQAAGGSPTAWQLPSEQSFESEAGGQSNPLRPKRTPATPPEPATFTTPANTTSLSAAQPASSAKPAAKVAQSAPAAVTQAAAVVPSKSAVKAAPPPANRPPANQRVASVPQSARGGPTANTFRQPAPNYQRPTSSVQHPSRVRQRLNIARQDAGDWVGEAEDLPIPGRAAGVRPDPFGPVPQAYGELHDGPYYAHPYGGYAACGEGVGCGDPCCDDPCCHPADCINEDLFCIGPGDNESCHTIRVRVPKVQEAMIFAGVQGFRGPYDRNRDSGNFGFHEGFNISGKVPYSYVGYQYGWRGTQNQLNGDKNTGDTEAHFQQFGTAGLFRRVTDGVQFGVAWDVLHDERFGARSFHQLRTELSHVECGTHEIGISVTVGLNRHLLEDPFLNRDVTFEASDQYLLFYRMHGRHGGEGRLYTGFNNDSDGIVGADMLLPVQDRWSVMTGFTYLIPDARRGFQGASQEAWNIGLSLVWHWDAAARRCHDNPYRPLFNVADNGYLIVNGR